MITSNITKKQLAKDFENAYIFIMSSVPTTGFTMPTSKRLYEIARPQLFTNENSSYIEEMNKKGETLLAAAGSFDPIIDFAALNTTKVIAFDINRQQFYIGCLKVWALLCLEYEKFYDFLVDAKTKSYLNRSLLNEIVKTCGDNESAGWFLTELWKRNPPSLIRDGFLFEEKQFSEEGVSRVLLCNYLKSKEAYNNAKSKISKVDIEFICDDILNISKYNINCKPDNAVLSNISDFIDGQTYCKFVINNIMPLLNSEGKVMAQYLIKHNARSIELFKNSSFEGKAMSFNGSSAFMTYSMLLKNQMTIFKEFEAHGSKLISFPTGKGRPFFGDEDSAVILTKKSVLDISQF